MGEEITTKSSNNVHEEDENHNCDSCDMTFKFTEELHLHIKNLHNGMKNYLCDMCQEEFAKMSLLELHISSVHLRLETFKCDWCSNSYKNLQALKDHKIVYHGFNEDVLREVRESNIKTSVKIFEDENSKEDQLEHENQLESNTENDSKEDDVVPSSIGESNETSEDSKDEQIEHENKPASNLESKYILEKPVIVESYNKNEKSNELRNKRRKKCKLCAKSFSQASDLYNHITKMHRETSALDCDTNQKVPNQQRHIKSVHEGLKYKKEYKCGSCGKTFTQGHNLKKHISRTHEGGNNSEMSTNNNKRKSLRKHIKIAHGKAKTKNVHEGLKSGNEESVVKSTSEESNNSSLIEETTSNIISKTKNSLDNEENNIANDVEHNDIEFPLQNVIKTELKNDVPSRIFEDSSISLLNEKELEELSDENNIENVKPVVISLTKRENSNSSVSSSTMFAQDVEITENNCEILNEEKIVKNEPLDETDGIVENMKKTEVDDDQTLGKHFLADVKIEPEEEEVKIKNESDDTFEKIMSNPVAAISMGIANYYPAKIENSQHKCCGQSFSSAEMLENHIDSIHAMKKYTCDICSTEYGRWDHFVEHNKLVHEGEKTFTDNKIGLPDEARSVHKIDNNDVKMKENAKNVVPISKKFACHMCKDSFDLPLLLKDHILASHGSLKIYNTFVKNISQETKSNESKQLVQVHKAGNDELNVSNMVSNYYGNSSEHSITTTAHKKNLSCDICQKKFTRKRYVLDHKRIVHYGIKREKVFQCVNCEGKSYASKRELIVHINSVHRKIKYKCDQCDSQFSRRSYIIEHKKSVHQQIVHYCDLCNKAFKKKSYVGEHKKYVHEIHPMFPCDLCNKEFKKQSYVREHKKAVHEINPRLFACDLCNKEFKKLSYVREHKKAVHENNGRYKICEHCNKPIKGGKDSLLRHIDSVHDQIKVKCDVCNKEFAKWGLREHKRSVHENNARYNICKHCNKPIKGSKEALLRHIESIHDQIKVKCDVCNKDFAKWSLHEHKKTAHEINPMFPCDLCGKEFKKRGYVREHKKIVHEIHPMLPCDLCNKEFKKLSYVREHKKVVHENNGRYYTCEQCNKPIKGSRDSLQKHIESVHLKLKSTCDICKKEFAKWSLQEHKKIAHEIRPMFPCNLCNKEFKTRSRALEHKKAVHENNGRYKTCHLCNKRIKGSRDTLQKHVDAVHDKLKSTCDICNKEFSKWSLSEHKKTTHEINPMFTCDLCNKEFKKRSYVREHKRKMHEKTNFPCDQCNEEFSQQNSLLTHKILVHEINPRYSTCWQCNRPIKGGRDNLQRHIETVHEGLKKFECNVCGKKYSRRSRVLQHKKSAHENM